MLPPMSETPVDVWRQWFTSLPPELADDLGAALGPLFPGGLLAVRGTRPSESVPTRLAPLATDPQSAAGLALTLSALTDTVVADRCDPARWSDTAALLDVLDASADDVLGDVEGVGELVEHARLRSPLWARQWKVQRERWREVRNGPLSAVSVMQWLRKARIASLAPPPG